MGPNIRQRCALALLAIVLAAGVRDSEPRLVAAAPSLDGTELPPATQIVDAVGAVWTLGSDFRVLRNGVHAASGYGRLINYSQQTVYVYGGDSRWWRWTGTGWTLHNPVAASPSGTAVPPASQVVDDGGNVWTLAPDRRVLRNGVHAGGGYSNNILWLNQTVYVLGLDGVWWYRWNGTGWVAHGQTAPGPSFRRQPRLSMLEAPCGRWQRTAVSCVMVFTRAAAMASRFSG